ncbi:hypothetical protein P152DRAFT_455061 [Eremomyces bilateralis CBS 781.70]|uniref:Uncharacterized protein n=1 Tax=Eremomyces bilateralis CBS 781.70 TaxID=1392243 RepID=A0A6G1GB95_9PEZI|nr:uncharacterized protein P152DRAFT_455061 [Eremomyces bilateralis CBS 781.70]KAF1815345.1 hypothetical protein P152DRAFT_455061 [Eremomyces bilateralis CBS 781.70]
MNGHRPERPHHSRQHTFPHANTSRRKPRRWPLVFRVTKGAVHSQILLAVLLHAAFTAVVVAVDKYTPGEMGLPSNIIPSLSIVVGLMLVFRNQTSYDRWWTGRNHFATICGAVRNLSRSFLTNVGPLDGKGGISQSPIEDGTQASESEKAETESVVRVLVAILYAVKFSLRGEWSDEPLFPGGPPKRPIIPGIPGWMTPSGAGAGVRTPRTPTASSASGALTSAINAGLLEASLASSATLTTPRSMYSSLLPESLASLEHRGVPLPLQLTSLVESYIRRGAQRNWFSAPQASGLTAQVGTLIDAFSRMETIRNTPIPVAHLIHARQVLALYICVLPFAMVDDMGWWSLPLVSLVSFTLYGIEGIGSQLEDPFGYDRNDINMDAIVADARVEVLALLEEWRSTGGRLFAI